jgi:triosephosphate isomerase
MLYGGSVTSENSKEILSVPGVDGLLVGKASLDAEEFLKICAL